MTPTEPWDDRSVRAVARQAVLACLALRSLPTLPNDPRTLFASPEVTALKKEIVEAGAKLWQRQYVDGNGGNLSARVSPEYVLCTPTLRSKGDLTAEDLCLVDFENRQVCGNAVPTSEILLHLEIYKAVPQARAVVHCHPPYATAHAIAGVVPEGGLLSEQEIFVGPVALTPYETPGTPAFAETIRPVAQRHNTILLANHGVVCWADTVTHAEWCVEVIETYCRTVMLARQLRSSLPPIAPEKIEDLLRIKQRLGLPDARLPLQMPAEAPVAQRSLCGSHAVAAGGGAGLPAMEEAEVERLTERITSELLRVMRDAG